MGQIKLYKKFFQISIIRTGSTAEQNYVLFDPYSLSANTYIAGTGVTESSSIIESNININQSTPGIYYVDLNSNLYASDITYDLVWFINYTTSSPIKKLSTRFRINVNNITNSIEIEYINAPLEIEYITSTQSIEVLGKY